MKLRLLLWQDCNRNCPGCCNLDWDLNSLPINNGYKGYSEIILTGGEPMLKPLSVMKICQEIRFQTRSKIYMYTAKVDNLIDIIAVLGYLDGICLTLHEQQDVFPFMVLNEFMRSLRIQKSMRLNVFKGVELGSIDLSLWQVKTDMEWIKDAPLPKNEVFKRLSP